MLLGEEDSYRINILPTWRIKSVFLFSSNSVRSEDIKSLRQRKNSGEM